MHAFFLSFSFFLSFFKALFGLHIILLGLKSTHKFNFKRFNISLSEASVGNRVSLEWVFIIFFNATQLHSFLLFLFHFSSFLHSCHTSSLYLYYLLIYCYKLFCVIVSSWVKLLEEAFCIYSFFVLFITLLVSPFTWVPHQVY